MQVIVISGKAQHGKDTTAGFLKDALEADGYSVLIAHYGDLVKYVCKMYLGWNGEKDEKGRQLLQELGTDIIRMKLNKPNFHVGRICEDIEICQDYVDYVLIDDTRFPNEIFYPKAMFDNKVVTVHIVRTGDFHSALNDKQMHHPSETALDDFDGYDYIIEAKDLDELYSAVLKFSERI